jgi:hypothetical protein
MKRSLSENVKKGATIIGGSILSVYSMWTMISSIPNANAAGTCIVTIFGKQYDVAPLQTSHSGGNVFTCGTDMSSVYQGMHGTNISKIASFIVTTPTPTPTPNPTPSPTPVVTPTPGVTPAPTPTPVVTPTPTPTGTVITHNDDSDDHENEEHRGDRDEDDDDKDEHKNSGRTRHHLDELKKEDRRGNRENEDDKKVHSESRNED